MTDSWRCRNCSCLCGRPTSKQCWPEILKSTAFPRATTTPVRRRKLNQGRRHRARSEGGRDPALDAGSAHYSTSLDAPAAGTEVDEPQSLGDSLGDDDELLALVETKLSLPAAIAHLPDLERRALRLRIEEDLTQVQIARRLGCSQMQVSRLLRRAAVRLRKLTDPDLS